MLWYLLVLIPGLLFLRFSIPDNIDPVGGLLRNGHRQLLFPRYVTITYIFFCHLLLSFPGSLSVPKSNRQAPKLYKQI